MDKRGLVPVEENSIHIAIGGIVRLYHDRREAGAAIKRRIADISEAIADTDAN